MASLEEFNEYEDTSIIINSYGGGKGTKVDNSRLEFYQIQVNLTK